MEQDLLVLCTIYHGLLITNKLKKITMKNIKYIAPLFVLTIFVACNDIEDVDIDIEEIAVAPELTSGSVDFSNYVALGASFTAGFTDNALFKAGQENSFPNLLSKNFEALGGGEFTQPLMNDNVGGLILGGQLLIDAEGDTLFKPRLVFGGAGPIALKEAIGDVMPTTDFLRNNPSGTFKNLGVPGAKSFHLLGKGYANIANFPAAANPYAIRLAADSPNASLLELAMAQNPTFFTLSEIGGNDVLGYATSGGDGTNPITDINTFNFAFNTLVTTLTSNGAKGAVTNVPYITDLPHFTTVPHNPLDPTNLDFGPQIPTLNTIYGAINQIFVALGETNRVIEFSETAASAVVIQDETLDNLSAQITGALNASTTFPIFVQQFGLPAQAAPIVAGLLGNAYGQARQATEDDLLVLPSSSVIGTVNTTSVASLMGQGLSLQLAGQFSAEGVSLPLEDKWVLLPSEQLEIKQATDAYNQTIAEVANANANIALVDLNSVLTEASTTGLKAGDYTFTTNLVTGGLISLDGIHLTSRGYAVMANKFLEQIDATFGSNFILSGNENNPGDYPTNYSPVLQ